MADQTKAEWALYYGHVLGILWLILFGTILQYGLDLPFLCWECWLDWNMFWDRFWATLPAFFGSLPALILYFVVKYKWASKVE